MSITNKKFAAFILTHGRPNRVKTYETLRKHGYTGKIFIIIDNEDKKQNEYLEYFQNEVIIFDKKEAAKKFDEADNFDDRRAIIYARNESFEIAKNLKLDYFIQLDDDYTEFSFRFDDKLNYFPKTKPINTLDNIFDYLVNFQEKTQCHSIALAQGGDFIGGSNSTSAKNITLKRKCMNSFICSVKKPFKFIGRINEDVNTYSKMGSIGYLFFTINQVSLGQLQTQSNKGGMTELYLDSGTYVKSFYSVMIQPSSVKIAIMGDNHRRIHHKVNWNNTVPKILSEKVKK